MGWEDLDDLSLINEHPPAQACPELAEGGFIPEL